jgi:hypothetical protein
VPTDEQMRDGLDALQSDMAEHQRRFKGEVTAEANRMLAVSAFEQLHPGWLDTCARDAETPPVNEPVGPLDETREINGRTYRMERAPVDDVVTRQATTDEAQTVAKVAARLELLLSKSELGSRGEGFMPEFVRGEFRVSRTPVSWLSWRDRALAVMSWKIAAQQPGNAPWRHRLEAMHSAMLIDLMNDSIAHFGDWKKDPEPTITVGA